MAPMPLTIGWTDLILRLTLATLAGVVLGLNREESGKPTGLRTTLLVCLAACVAMLQVNALLAQAGKSPGSLVELDLMRLPLGILSGVGFIGAGAILRRDGLITGMTTAATLWFVTVIGLCFGGGQLTLGLIALGLGVIVLIGMKRLERRLTHWKHATLTVRFDAATPYREPLRKLLDQHPCRWHRRSVRREAERGYCTEVIDLRWRARGVDDLVGTLADAVAALGARDAHAELLD